MNWFKAGCSGFCLLLSFFIISGLQSQPALSMSNSGLVPTAMEPGQVFPSEPEDSVRLESKYPALRGNASSTFEFQVSINYKGKEAREFRLSANTPEGFLVSIRPAYEAKEISSIFLEARRTYPEVIKVLVSPAFFLYTEKLPAPGEYVITFTAISPDEKLKASIDLKIVITAKYDMDVQTGGTLEGRLNTKVTAGDDNHLTMVIINTGTVPLEKLIFSSEKPGGWSITFEPNEIESIASGISREVDINIKPPRKTISGDYEVALKVDTKNSVTYDRLNIRVTVSTSAIWGWVGVGIVVLVVAGLAVIFMRLSRR